MQVTSLGYKTDLIFPAFDGEIIDCESYLVIRTPANRDFYWGNFLLFSGPPVAGDFEIWTRLFIEEISSKVPTKHQAFGWDSTEGEEGASQEFVDAGFRLNRYSVMASEGPFTPVRLSEAVEVRKLTSESDWQQSLENKVACKEPELEEATCRKFLERQTNRYRSMTRAGLGDWYGAFHGDQLVADLGIYHDDGVGRYQTVQTHPEFRQRGIGTALISKSGQQAFDKYDLRMLVIVSEEDSPARRLYESVGFKRRESQVGLTLRPPEDLQ